MEDQLTPERTTKHLEGMRQADFWTTEDMAPIDAAIVSGNSAIAQ